MDITGKTVLIKNITDTVETIDVRLFRKGIYFVLVNDGKYRKS